MLPILLRGTVKLLTGHISFELVSGGELWFCLAIMALLISQDLKNTRPLLANSDKIQERNAKATLFFMAMIPFVFACAINEVLYIIAIVDNISKYRFGYEILTCLSYAFAILLIWYSLLTRRQFNLTCNFL